MGQYSGYHLSDSEGLCHESPCHDSDLFGDLARQAGILATRACYLPGFLKPGHRYLHRVQYHQHDIAHIHEEGHHDGASSFSTLEYVLLSGAEIVESWKLSNPDDLSRLAKSDFTLQMHRSLFGAPHDCIVMLAQGLGANLDRQCLEAFGLKTTAIAEVIGKLPVSLLRQYVDSGLLDETALLACYEQNLYCAVRDFQQRQKGESADSNLLLLFDETFQPSGDKVRQAVARYQLIAGGQWQCFLPDSACIEFNERQFGYVIDSRGEDGALSVLRDLPLVLTLDVQPHIRRALVTGRISDAVVLLKRYANHKQGFHAWIREYVAVYGRVPRFRFDVLPFYEEVKREQFSAGSLTLRQLCESGYAAALDQHLKTENPPLKALNSALPYAADMGYAHMVKRLHEAGADLDTWANYAIKTATSKGYGPLLRYLRDNGVSWEAPEVSASEWGF